MRTIKIEEMVIQNKQNFNLKIWHCTPNGDVYMLSVALVVNLQWSSSAQHLAAFPSSVAWSGYEFYYSPMEEFVSSPRFVGLNSQSIGTYR